MNIAHSLQSIGFLSDFSESVLMYPITLTIHLTCIALFGGMILLPLYWQGIRHESVVDTGLLTAPQGLGMALIMPLAGKLTDRMGGGPLALFGVIVTTVATIPFGLIGAPELRAASVTLLNVSYDPTRELYEDYN